MKKYLFAMLVIVSCSVSYATMPMPAWDRVEGKSVSFFASRGFELDVDDSMAHNYDEPTVEISLVIPADFTDASIKYEFSSLLLLSKDVAVDVAVFPHDGKRRAILTISEDMIQKSQVIFYFKNQTKTATGGTVRSVSEREKNGKKAG